MIDEVQDVLEKLEEIEKMPTLSEGENDEVGKRT